ncbi:MAG TPA: TonB-dependent receptor [Chitinophagaceae bacterium]
MQKFYLVQIALLCALSAGAQNTGSVSGIIRDAVNGKPAEGATISVDQLERRTTADSLGKYSLTNLPVGSYSITVSAIGYETQTKYNLPITSGNNNEVSFDLLRASGTLNAVTVTGTRRTARAASLETPLSVQRLTTEEIKSNPGGNFDISRVVQSLPGITGSDGIGNGYRNDIIIRGGAPYENVYYLDGIEVPVINHFSTQGSAGGPQGIFNVSFIEDVRVSTSSFDARFDNALSGIFEFKQKNGNPNRVQGNVRLSASELAATFDGPISKKITFLASARRSYLQFLFKALDLPIRPDYYDFQYKISYLPDSKNSFSFIGVGAIDQFRFGTIRKPTLEKYLVLDNVPSNNQWNYTVGALWKRSLTNGYVNVSLSRNVLDIELIKYDGNDETAGKLRINTTTRETENKMRVDVSQTLSGWKLSYGTSVQYVDYLNNSFIRRRAAISDENGNVIQPADVFQYNTAIDFWRYGMYAQLGKRLFGDRLNISAGLRGDAASFLTKAKNPFENLSPRLALSFAMAPKWTLNASAGSYTKLPPYTIIGFQENNVFVNRNADYIRTNHFVAGLEYLPKPTLRFTVEGFYKKYSNVPVSLRDGISLNNLGGDFAPLGNEPIASSGEGEAYGAEFFAQQKLTKRLFGFVSYTYVISRFSGLDGKLLASAWDNRHLFSFTLGYKMKRAWEIGLKYRFQGGLPYTPFDETASRLNYVTFGNGILDYNRFNQRRLGNFQQSDLRIDKKWNFKKVTLDLFIDVQNWTAFKKPVLPQYTFDRDLTNGNFITTDGQPLKSDGSNAVPQILTSNSSVPLPTIGFILEF